MRCSCSLARSQYQIRLHDRDPEGNELIYAPRDKDCYLKRATAATSSKIDIHVDRRLSRERQLIRKLADSLDRNSNAKKQMMYDKLRSRHNEAMQLIIADMNRGTVTA